MSSLAACKGLVRRNESECDQRSRLMPARWSIYAQPSRASRVARMSDQTRGPHIRDPPSPAQSRACRLFRSRPPGICQAVVQRYQHSSPNRKSLQRARLSRLACRGLSPCHCRWHRLSWKRTEWDCLSRSGAPQQMQPKDAPAQGEDMASSSRVSRDTRGAMAMCAPRAAEEDCCWHRRTRPSVAGKAFLLPHAREVPTPDTSESILVHRRPLAGS